MARLLKNGAFLSGWVLACAYPLITLAQTPPAKDKPAPHREPPASNPAPRSAPEPRSEPQPRYNPPPSNPAPRSEPEPRYNPPPSNSAPGQSNHAPQRSNPPSSYTPNRQAPAPSAPGASSGTIYRPRSSSSSSPSGSPASGPKAPVTYTPGASKSAGSSGGATRTTGGATVYTPRAPGTSTYTPHPPTSPKAATTFTPKADNPRSQPVYKVPPSAVASHTGNGSSSLNSTGSHSVVEQLNSTRAGMKGVNRTPLPSGNVTVHGNGNLTVEAANGAKYGVRQDGTLASYSAPGRSVAFAPNGRIQSVHTASLDIRRGVHGERTVVSRRPDNSVLVSTGARRGYLERTVVSGNRTFIRRSYYAGGVNYSRLYRTYAYGGGMLPYYVPGVYYSPAFYGWAFYPWANPIAYSWGWGGEPWFNAYGGYFSPAMGYASGFAWLTDYYLSRTMAAAYDDQSQPDETAAAGYPDGGQAPPDDPGAYPASDNTLAAPADTPITPQLKALITEEVHRQLAYENAIASGTAQPTVAELPSALKPDRIFVVSSNLDVSANNDQTCTLSAGDVLQLATPPGDSTPLAGLRVAASRQADCPAGTEVNLSAQDLADMQNNLRAQMDAGLDAMHAGQGQRGLPSAPPSAMAQPPQPVALDVPLPPDPNVGTLLDAQQAEARQTEAASMRTVTAALR